MIGPISKVGAIRQLITPHNQTKSRCSLVQVDPVAPKVALNQALLAQMLMSRSNPPHVMSRSGSDLPQHVESK